MKGDLFFMEPIPNESCTSIFSGILPFHRYFFWTPKIREHCQEKCFLVVFLLSSLSYLLFALFFLLWNSNVTGSRIVSICVGSRPPSPVGVNWSHIRYPPDHTEFCHHALYHAFTWLLVQLGLGQVSSALKTPFPLWVNLYLTSPHITVWWWPKAWPGNCCNCLGSWSFSAAPSPLPAQNGSSEPLPSPLTLYIIQQPH